MNSTVLAILSGFALALGACGGDDGGGGGSDEDQVREVAQQLATNDKAACDKVTAAFLKKLDSTKEECRKAAEEEDVEDAKVDAVKVNGDTATAVVVDEDRTTLKFVKRDGDWLVNDAEVEEGGG